MAAGDRADGISKELRNPTFFGGLLLPLMVDVCSDDVTGGSSVGVGMMTVKTKDIRTHPKPK